MRIAIVAGPQVPVPPVKYGGTEQVIYYLIKGLQAAGHEPILFGPGDSQVDCEIVPTTDKAISFARHKSEVNSYEKQVRRIEHHTAHLLRQHLPELDIIHSHGFDLKPLSDFPNLTTIHGKIDFETLQFYLSRQGLYYASISQNQQGACPELQYVATVYNGEDPTDFPIVEKAGDYVCFLGRFDRDKNPHLAIELAISLGIKIKVAGKIDYQGDGYFEECVERYFDHPLVEYMGELDFTQKAELLSRAKCNLHPTGFREPFGLTVLEAAYCGTPTLAIDRGSMPELIEEGRTGMLVEDFVEGYHQIEKCFSMDRMYIANRARMLFNYKTMTRHYIQAYRSVLEIFDQKRQTATLRNLARLNRRDIRTIFDK